jgi:hypothetical protein
MIEYIYICVVVIMLGIAIIVHVHHVDNNAFLKGKTEPDPDDLDLVFEHTPNCDLVLEQVRIDLHWNEPSDVVELEGRHDVRFAMHIHWNTMRINSDQHWVS